MSEPQPLQEDRGNRGPESRKGPQSSQSMPRPGTEEQKIERRMNVISQLRQHLRQTLVHEMESEDFVIPNGQEAQVCKEQRSLDAENRRNR